MRRIEEDFTGFASNWVNKPQAQVLEEMSSWSLETKRIPDPYYFDVEPDGKLISPETGVLVEYSIRRETPLEQLEWEAFQHIQHWAREASQGVSFWISQPDPERSEYTKVVASELKVDDGQKRLFNRAIKLELDETEALELHQKLSQIAGEKNFLTSPDRLRSTPVFLDNPHDDWTVYLNVKISDQPILDMVRNSEDVIQKEVALKKSGIIYDKLFTGGGYDDDSVKTAIVEAEKIEYFGKSDGSCPPGAFDRMWLSSASIETFDCPNCPYKIPSGKGITKCPGCGITKEQAGSRCV